MSGSPSKAVPIMEEGERSWPDPEQMRKDFEGRIKVVNGLAAGTQFLYAMLMLIGTCALAWGTAVLLGAYVASLSIGDFYAVGMLLLAGGIRLWLAGRASELRRKVTVPVRFLMHLAVFGISSCILVTAVYSLLPDDAQTWMRRRVFQLKSYSPPPASDNLRRALRIFYGLMLLDGLTACVGVVFLNLLRWQHVEGRKSLEAYHDRLVQESNIGASDSEELDWLAGQYFPGPDFLFKVLAREYRSCTAGIVSADPTSPDERRLEAWCWLFKYHPAKADHSDQLALTTNYWSIAERICKDYSDLIWFAYLQEAGFEAAEGALGSGGDPYERGAVANVLVFWVALEEGLSNMPQRVIRPPLPLPLRFQQRLLSRMADVAADSYGWAGCAAASAFALLLERSTDPAVLVTQVRSADGNKELLHILIERVAMCTRRQPNHAESTTSIHSQPPTYDAAASWGHIQALGSLLRHLNPASSPHIVEDLYKGIIGADSNISEAGKLDRLKADVGASQVELELQNLKRVLTSVLTTKIRPAKPLTFVPILTLGIVLSAQVLGLLIINGLLHTS